MSPREWLTKGAMVLPPGWHAVWRNADGSTYQHPVPAVLVERDEDDHPEVRVVAAKFDGQFLVPLVDYYSTDVLVGVFGPGEDPW